MIGAWWLVRTKLAAAIALVAVACGNRALRRIRDGRSARFSLPVAGFLLNLSLRVLPKPLTATVDELVRRQFGE